jgi:hypothetical protein
MKSLLDLVKALYGPKALSSTLGTRTNVVRLPTGKLQRYLKEDLNIEAASDNAAINTYKEMEQLVPDIPKMNDSERLIFEGNLRRLKNKLEAADLIPKQKAVKEGEVVGMETKEKITGEELKKLVEEKGTVNPPTTLSGQLEGQGKKLENLGKKIDEEFIAGKKKKTAGEILEEYFTSYKSMKEVEDQALVRAVAREIMYQDLKAGKLKVPKDVEDVIRGIGPANRDVLDEFNQWYGFAAIEDLHDNAHRFYTMPSPKEAVDFIKKNKYSNWEEVYQPREKPIKEYMTPGEFQNMLKDATVNKYGVISPKASESLDKETAKEIYDFYLKSGDRKLIQDEITGITEGKKFDVYKVEDRNKIIDILTDILKKLGPPAVAGGVGLEYLAEKTTPQTEGGTQQSLGLDYLTGMEPSEGYADGGRIGFKTGGGKKILDLINKANKELKGKKSMETVNPKTGEITVPKEPVKATEEPRTLGGLPIDERSANISDEIDKLRASGINSLENEKKLNKLSLEFVDSLDPRRANKSLDFRRKSLDTENKLIIKAEEEGLDFDTYEKLRQGLYGSGKQKTLDFIKTGKIDLEPIKSPTTFKEVSSRYKDAAKAADEIFPNYDQPKTAASELAEVMAEQKYGKVFDDLSGDQQQELYEEAYNYITSVNKLPKVKPPYKPGDPITDENFGDTPFAPSQETLDNLKKAREMTKGMSLEEEMNMVLNQYDKSMFIKNDQGMVDVANPENVRKMALLLKRDHPELYRRLEGGAQTNILEDFDVTGREPNANGGRIGYAEGSDGAPSITLDTHDKAPDNMDKYPIRAGNLELGISGLMTGGKSYQANPYNKITGSERNFSVRGKYNVPDTGVSLLGDIGDVRMRNTQNINAPQYNYKETIRDVMRAKPYSVGIEYAPNQNRNINLRYDDQGNVTLRGEYKFAKGGLGYLMGE